MRTTVYSRILQNYFDQLYTLHFHTIFCKDCGNDKDIMEEKLFFIAKYPGLNTPEHIAL